LGKVADLLKKELGINRKGFENEVSFVYGKDLEPITYDEQVNTDYRQNDGYRHNTEDLTFSILNL
jgi:hypothetical protein